MLIFIPGFLAGAVFVAIVYKSRVASATIQARRDADVEIARISEQLNSAMSEASRLDQDNGRCKSEMESLRKELEDSRNSLTMVTANLEAEKKQSIENKAFINNARQELSDQFKALAGEILEEKAKRFTEQNQVNIEGLLNPLKLKLTEFQGKVEEVYVQEGKDRSALAAQVKHLMELNNQLSKDANNLATALKGSSKTRGNWGEMILEKILESSGLRKGAEYNIQESHTSSEGSRLQPDVVIHLPEERHVVIDSKVSLNAYEEYASAESDIDRDIALKRHLESVKRHIKELSEKSYHTIYDLKTLDFVIMFIPVEPAFMLAISEDNSLWEDAWKRSVLLVSPSTLLFVLKTVAYLWRQEQQNRNAQDIAQRGAALYDKLAGFVDDLKNVGNRLEQAKNSYDEALGKLSSGRGNLIRQAELLKELGIKPGKSLPAEMVEIASDVQGIDDK